MSLSTSPLVRPQGSALSGTRPVALAAIETATVASGVRVADQIVKTAPVQLFLAEPVSPGKFVIVFGGTVGDVHAAFQKGVDAAGSALLDSLNLPQCHADVFSAFEGIAQGPAGEALGVLEADSIPATLLAADKAVKTAPVRLRRIRLANALGGKGFVYLDGTVSDVNAAVNAAKSVIGAHLADSVVIPRLAEAVRDRLY
ncbi:MAG: BMC domain-containing protein [Candidatus Eiseniibacteriota bacterium]